MTRGAVSFYPKNARVGKGPFRVGILERSIVMDKRIPELYGSLVFNDRIMREKLPKDVYKALR